MKAVALGFSCLTLFSIIVAVLVNRGIYIDILPGNPAGINVAVFSTFSILLAVFNAAIVYGLLRQKLWAVISGSIEMVILIIAVIANLVSGGLSDIVSSLYWLIIAAFFLLALKAEYNEIKRQRETHV